jgi:hypothetical protein
MIQLQTGYINGVRCRIKINTNAITTPEFVIQEFAETFNNPMWEERKSHQCKQLGGGARFNK